MVDTRKRNTNLPVVAELLDRASDLGVNMPEVNETNLTKAAAEARCQKWLDENAKAFSEQSDWHERNGHPLVDIIEAPGGSTWSTDLP